MYTLYGCLQINQELNINPIKTYIKVLDFITTGTTAELKRNKLISLNDVYYAMMLPSGNDAASLLAFYYGYWLDMENTFPNLIFSKVRKVDLKNKIKYSNLLIKRFMHYLNEKIIQKELKHTNSHLENPHGLANKFHVSFI